MKIVVCVEATHLRNCRLTFYQWLAFCFGWFGMRPALFEKLSSAPLSDWRTFVIRGVVRLVCGISLISIAWLIIRQNSVTSAHEPEFRILGLTTFLLLIGLTLSLHFGLFNLLAGYWRFRGVRCASLFRAPLFSKSLAEFWGQRWNVAFSEMTTVAVFRPIRRMPWLANRSTQMATFAAFVFSGILHEVAISLPVNNGFGLPMLYFVINGTGMAIEKRIPFLKSRVVGRVWTGFVVLVPLPLLFHRPFLEGCIWPLFTK